jgi:hypothetical protein
MMFREPPVGTASKPTLAISQPSHAWLAGQIIRAWGNDAFGAVIPYEDVCLGAEQHDIGWLVWEQAPTLNPVTGRPHSFRDLGVAAHTAIWRQGTEMALALGRYPALLVSLHGSGLYVNFDMASDTEDAATVRDFLAGQQEIQRRLIDGLRADRLLSPFAAPEMIERNRGLVRAADRMSIALCTALQDSAIHADDPRDAIVRQVPTAHGETVLRLHAIDDEATTIVIAPWPFAKPRITVTCEGIPLPPGGFADQAEMRAALRDAARVILSFDLRPD